MSDLLSASSLLVAIAAMLFSLWYPEIVEALEITPKSFWEDNVKDQKTVTTVLFTKALPVAVMTGLIALIFAPDAANLALRSLESFRAKGFETIKRYDAVGTAYCFVSLLTIVLAAYMSVLAGKLWKLSQRLKTEGKPQGERKSELRPGRSVTGSLDIE